MGTGALAIPKERKLYSNGVHAGRGCWSLFNLLLGACIVQAAFIESCMELRGLEVSKILQPLRQRWMFLV